MLIKNTVIFINKNTVLRTKCKNLSNRKNRMRWINVTTFVKNTSTEIKLINVCVTTCVLFIKSSISHIFYHINSRIHITYARASTHTHTHTRARARARARALN